jgi:hypothetical protein
MSPQMRSKLLRYVMQQVGLSTLIFRGNPMGVFLGAIDRSALEALRDGVSRHARPMLSWEKAIARFKSEFDTQPTDQFRDDPRQQAVGRRARRALETTLEDIRLSSRVEQLSEMAV